MGEIRPLSPEVANTKAGKKEIAKKIRSVLFGEKPSVKQPAELTQPQIIEAINKGEDPETYWATKRAEVEAKKAAKLKAKQKNAEYKSMIKEVSNFSEDDGIVIEDIDEKQVMRSEFDAWQKQNEAARPQVENIKRREIARQNITAELKFYGKIASNIKDLLPLAQAKNFTGLEQQLVIATGNKEWSANIARAFKINTENKKAAGLMYTLNDGLSAIESSVSFNFGDTNTKGDKDFIKTTGEKIEKMSTEIEQAVIEFQNEAAKARQAQEDERQTRADEVKKRKENLAKNMAKLDAKRAQKVSERIKKGEEQAAINESNEQLADQYFNKFPEPKQIQEDIVIEDMEEPKAPTITELKRSIKAREESKKQAAREAEAKAYKEKVAAEEAQIAPIRAAELKKRQQENADREERAFLDEYAAKDAPRILENKVTAFTFSDLQKHGNLELLQNVLQIYADKLKQNFGITWKTEPGRAGVSNGIELYRYLQKIGNGASEKPSFFERIQAKIGGWDKYAAKIDEFKEVMDKIFMFQEKLDNGPRWSGEIKNK